MKEAFARVGFVSSKRARTDGTGEQQRPLPRRDRARERAAEAARLRLVRRSLAGHVGHGFRSDVEGMRGFAVAVVVAFHAGLPTAAGPFHLSGGFVGVDVFFVLSGFLITRLILGELESTGTLALPTFWARRARRLLPASALVVVATVVAGKQLLAPLAMRDLATDAITAGTFTANFGFAHRLGDYFAAQLNATTPSPLLHFWSLAVEEQFYLLWPPLLVLLTRRPRQFRRLVVATIGVVGITGFVLAATLTPKQPAWAFYLLPTRMGELLAGAALAAAGGRFVAIARPWRAAIGWAGIATLAGCVLVLDETVPWPGVAVVIPVAATMAVLIAGPSVRLQWAPGRMLAAQPLQWLGRHSYALYLWHWPVLVLATAQWGPLSPSQRIGAVAFAIGLSALSVPLVENPLRHSRYLAALPARSLAVGAMLTTVVIVAGLTLRGSTGQLDAGVEASAPELVAPGAVTLAPAAVVATTLAAVTTTTAAPATDTAAAEVELVSPPPPTGALGQLVGSAQQTLGQNVGLDNVPSNLRPSLGAARDRSQVYQDGCVNIGANDKLQPCEYGTPGATRTILLYGDSHAAQWFEPLNAIARQHGFRLVVALKGGCPIADVVVATPVLRYTCPPYRDRAIAWIDKNAPEVVIVANSYTHTDATAEEWSEGTASTMARLAEVSSNVVVIGDNPASLVDSPDCLSQNLTDASECATPRADAIRPDRISAEVVAASAHGITFVDTTDWFCTDDTCPPIVGNVLVMRDETHITVPMAEFLTPLVAAAIGNALTR